MKNIVKSLMIGGVAVFIVGSAGLNAYLMGKNSSDNLVITKKELQKLNSIPDVSQTPVVITEIITPTVTPSLTPTEKISISPTNTVTPTLIYHKR